jgi:hypothetical protein
MAYDVSIPPKGIGCHRTGFTLNCRDLVVDGRCERWRHETVMVDGKMMAAFDCVDHWHAQHTRETVMQVNGLARDIESLRNELMALAGHPNGHPAAVAVGAPFGVARLEAADQKLLE